MKPRHVVPTCLSLLLSLLALASSIPAAEDAASVEKNLAEAARYLSSDALEGRGPGTKGLDLAAEYIAAQFTKYGLKTTAAGGGPFQKFVVTTTVNRGPSNRLVLVSPAKAGAKPETIDLKLDEDFTPLAIGGNGKFDLPLVFAGYGITGQAEKYDDYAGIDVAGKAVVLLRHEPQQAAPKSAFNGTKPSSHASFERKVANARDHKAAAVFFCSDDFDVHKNVDEARKKWQEALEKLAKEFAQIKTVSNPTLEQIEGQRKRIEELTREVTAASERMRSEFDPVLHFEGAGRDNTGAAMPVIFCRRSIINRMIRASLGKDLAAIEQQIDQDLKPRSAVLTGWRAAGEVQVERKQLEVRNVIGVLEGEGAIAEETIVIGAHYDHLGYGGPGSLARGVKAIHHGADDNASGVAVLLEVARQLTSQAPKPRRRLVFIAFAGEELGLLGSNHYVGQPVVPLKQTVAMLNLDMVGRLRESKLVVGGPGTSPRFDPLLDSLNAKCGFQLTKTPAGFGPSDQLPFYSRQIPVMHFFTGLHEDYHRPSDRFEKLNLEGMRRIGGLVREMAIALATDAKRPEYAGPNPFFRWVLQKLPEVIASAASRE